MTNVEQSDSVPSSIGEEIGLVEIVGFFKRQWLAIAAIAAVVTVVYHGLFVHPPFRSAATLMVVSPTVAPDPETGELSLLGYRRLLDSDAVRGLRPNWSTASPTQANGPGTCKTGGGRKG